MNFMRNVLRHRNFRWLFGGQFMSNVGNSLFILALFWYVQASTHSASDVAWVGFAMTIPSLGGFLTGFLADLVDRRRLLWITDGIRFVLVAIITFMVLANQANLAAIALAVVLVSVAGNLFWPASQALLPSLVPEEDLVSANGWMQSSGQFAQGLAALLGSIIIASVGVVMVFGFDALTFLVSVWTLLLLRLPSSASKVPAPRDALPRSAASWWQDTLQGLKTLWKWPMIRWVLPGVIIMNLAYAPFFTMSAAWSQEILHRGSFGYSMLVLAEALGNLLGGLMAGGLARRFQGVAPWVFSMILTLPILAFPAMHLLWGDFLALLAFGIGTGLVNTLFLTLLQQRISEALLGRVFATLGTIFGAALPLGTALSGIAVGGVGIGGIFWAASAAIVAAACYLGGAMVWHPEVRSQARLSA